MADSWPARTDGEKITPRLVGETGACGGDGDGAVACTTAGTTPSGMGRTQLPSCGLGGGDQRVGDGGVEDRGADVVGGAALDEVAGSNREGSFNDEEAAVAGRPR
jgi:hypothetical protein